LLLALAGAMPCRAGALPDTIERIKPSIVAVGTYQKTRSPPFQFRGTGFVIGDGTRVATNAHVLPEQLDVQQREVLVVMVRAGGEPQPREAALMVTDGGHDVAVLRINGAPLPALSFASDAVREGDMVAFTGFPVGGVLGLAPVTHRGMVSAITPIALPMASARQLDPRVVRRVKAGTFSVLQLDATAYPGNSGSPLFDIESGRVVGIINMVFVKGTRESVLSHPSGITFAIPIRHLAELLSAQESGARDR
jgi:S1-C subfamily serine protease